jgi:alkanesulfonate monooxygenase SsuD/methylene tetrahydromethanopterin reductase-like flavin-dependent oxidoreductase (luciferase family)
VDNWSNGRLELGVGQGYRIDEFSGFCMSRPERTARMAEGIQLVDRLWTEEKVTFEGKFSRVKNVTISPRPVQKPRPAHLDRREGGKGSAAGGTARLQSDGDHRA